MKLNNMQLGFLADAMKAYGIEVNRVSDAQYVISICQRDNFKDFLNAEGLSPDGKLVFAKQIGSLLEILRNASTEAEQAEIIAQIHDAKDSMTLRVDGGELLPVVQ